MFFCFVFKSVLSFELDIFISTIDIHESKCKVWSFSVLQMQKGLFYTNYFYKK